MYDLESVRLFRWGQNSAKFADIKGIIRSGKTIGRQYNGQMKQNKGTNSDLQCTTQ